MLTHLDSGLPFLNIGGEARVLACLPTPAELVTGMKVAALPPVPQSEWREMSLRNFAADVYDQDGQGSCGGHGTVAAYSISRHVAGMLHQRLSPCFVYGNVNGGSDRGSAIGDLAQELAGKGTCLESTVGPKQIWARYYSQAAYQEALRFRAARVEAIQGDLFAGIAASLLENQPVVFGVNVGRSFDPDARGVIPDAAGGGGGHCMAAIGLKQIGGKWYIETQNSWGHQWGQEGFCYMPDSYFRGGWAEAFRILASVDDPQEPDPLPTA